MNRATVRGLASALLTAFLLCAAVQVFAFTMYLGLRDQAYSLHNGLFPMSEHEFDLAVYTFLGALKALGLTLFLVPWAALRLTAGRFPE